MEKTDELSRRELLSLKEIRLTDRTINCAIARQLLDKDMIVELQDNRLQLTEKGRHMLVRGSPSLWHIAS